MASLHGDTWHQKASSVVAEAGLRNDIPTKRRLPQKQPWPARATIASDFASHLCRSRLPRTALGVMPLAVQASLGRVSPSHGPP